MCLVLPLPEPSRGAGDWFKTPSGELCNLSLPQGIENQVRFSRVCGRALEPGGTWRKKSVFLGGLCHLEVSKGQ